MSNLLKLIIDSNEREVARLRSTVTRVNALEPRYKEYSDEQLKQTTANLRDRLDNGESLDSLIPDAFAAVREASVRTLGMRHFDVQIMGGVVLHQGRIAEMKTGEGKTLVATCPLFVNALTRKGAHLVTVNPYLAKRDATWMGQVFHALGMTVGILQHESSLQFDPDFESGDPNWPHVRPITRKEAYECDITYGMNSEFAFDYLRDNMVWSIDDCVQREHHFAIVDEVDSILIDEARTPHIISGEGVGEVDLYHRVDQVVARLREEEDFTVEEKHKTAMLTEEGTHHAEKLLGVDNLTELENHEMMHHVQASLKARYCFRRDIDYVVQNGEVIIVDEFTGRMMPGRRWGDGLHQAVEAKEGVNIQQENQTVATITIQNFFRLYAKLAGMTGTAKTEEGEFRKIYGLDVVKIPTNVPVVRADHPDTVFKSEDMKFRGVTEEIVRYHARRQPVLVGTRSIEISERLHRRLAPDRLQLLAGIHLLRNRIENDKMLSGEQRQEMHQFLNRRFHDPLDDLLAGQALTDESPDGSEAPVDTGPRLRGLRDLAAIASKVTPRLNLNLLEPENVRELAATWSIPELQDRLAEILADGVKAEVLNAKYHEREAEIIAEAGRLDAVTIATNMAGRGVDILLGGKSHPDAVEVGREVRTLGGLHIVGTERHESRRIDNQLRGRAGRQGDPGSTRYFVSLEDELWRLFGDRTKSFGMNLWDEWLPINSKLVSAMIERTQKKVEMHHFDIRKHTLQYDEVLNDQRTIIYKERRKILEGADLKDNIETYLGELVNQELDLYCSAEVEPDSWDRKALWNALNEYYPLVFHAGSVQALEGKGRADLQEFLLEAALTEYHTKEEEISSETMREVERYFALQILTSKWMEHLDAMDYLREGIGLRGYAQFDPVLAYRQEGANYFDQMVNSWKRDLIASVFKVQIEPQKPEPPRAAPRPMRMVENTPGADGYDPITEMARGAGPVTDPDESQLALASASRGAAVQTRPISAPVVNAEKVGRNDPCPCGSGKKYKKCCLLTEN
ncbi:MAG TPA: SEC-C metal-binding domain-containing protein [Armatimonadota bacterium]|nr:SEC-C metal-binding domain-containing protein [Armatimonadota bacterium]